jgi:hypothetical protein
MFIQRLRRKEVGNKFISMAETEAREAQRKHTQKRTNRKPMKP